MSFDYRRKAIQKHHGISDAKISKMDAAWKQYHLDLAAKKALKTIPCLAPSEMVCVNCGRTAPVDEIQWDLYDQQYGSDGFILCIDCEDER
jgi:hypothetical protein